MHLFGLPQLFLPPSRQEDHSFRGTVGCRCPCPRQLLPGLLEGHKSRLLTYPRHSMYAIYAYIGVVFGVNVGIYGIHGVPGYYSSVEP